MNRREFEKKYAIAIQGIIDGGNDTNVAPGVQPAEGGTAVAMLKDMAMKQDPTLYKGLPKGFDLVQCKADAESITD